MSDLERKTLEDIYVPNRFIASAETKDDDVQRFIDGFVRDSSLSVLLVTGGSGSGNIVELNLRQDKTQLTAGSTEGVSAFPQSNTAATIRSATLRATRNNTFRTNSAD